MSLIKEYFTQEETEAENYVCNLCQKTCGTGDWDDVPLVDSPVSQTP